MSSNAASTCPQGRTKTCNPIAEKHIGLLHGPMQKEYIEPQIMDDWILYAAPKDDDWWFDSPVGVTYGCKLIRASGPGPRCLFLAQVAKFPSRWQMQVPRSIQRTGVKGTLLHWLSWRKASGSPAQSSRCPWLWVHVLTWLCSKGLAGAIKGEAFPSGTLTKTGMTLIWYW